MPSKKRALRTDIQALRAIAVGLVILNHLWPERLTGGYVGVDIFFVISGYLISAHLLSEFTRNGRIRFATFYARRAKRLLPAALLVAFVSLAGVVLLMPSDRWARTAQETFAASAYFENWLLAANSVDYSAQDLDATTVQHYWSLSVEEQFYLLWPLALTGLVLLATWLVRRGVGRGHGPDGTRTTKTVLAVGIAAIGIASFAFAVLLTAEERSLAYFHTLARVWEFMSGALLALLAPTLARLFVRWPAVAPWRGLVHWLGLGAIAWSALRFDAETPFPGPWAVVPVIATAAIIATGEQEPPWSPLRPLRWRPIQYGGDISYSLYLWHWPLIVLAPFALARELGFLDRVAIILITVALAAATKRYVEDPGRSRLLASARPRTTLLVTAGTILVAGALAATTVFGAGVMQQREADDAAAYASSECFGAQSLSAKGQCDPFIPAEITPQGDHNSPWVVPKECAHAERQIIGNGKPSLYECDFSPRDKNPEDSPLIWLVGDSHADHWKAAVYDLARGNGWRVNAVMQGGCPIVDTPRVEFKGRKDKNSKKADECRRWSNEVTERISETHPALILVSTFGSQAVLDDGTGRPQQEQYDTAVRKRFAQWKRSGAKISVIRDIPYAKRALGPDCVVREGKNESACTAPQEQVLAPDPVAVAAKRLKDSRVSVTDLTDRFCLDGQCHGIIGGVPVYYDGDHMARSYSQSLAPALGEALSKAAGMELAPPRSSGATPVK
ncbi:acyltransferase [Leucobacter sp. CSA2]|uniref:Acyltransferase n=1 Tax=Leucobacter edaphi TaxID=2796472 RepID=A0A934QBI1_9MICO|nr:acyltransferase [Leucobacter edaphi]